MSTLRSLAAAAAIAATAYAAACSDAPTAASTRDAASLSAGHASQGHNGGVVGTTGGWADGRTVQFRYSRPFFCEGKPVDGSVVRSTSGCAVGVEGDRAPRGGPIPVVYVVVPLGFRPADATLQCPEIGNCINHPSTLDLSRLFGDDAANVPLPAHSHVIGREDGAATANAGWWELEVVGVPTPEAWNELVAGKSLETVRSLQRRNLVTGDIPTNSFLFFGVRN